MSLSLGPGFRRDERDLFLRFDLTDLKLFCEVVDAGSITAGAEKSALALGAASTRIRGMEEQLGARLLTRSRQGVTPTEAGRTLLRHARAILAQSARMREDLGAYAGGLSGEVRQVAQAEARLKEAAKLGFESACLPRRVARGRGPLAAPEGLALCEIGHLADLVARFAPAADKSSA